MMRVLAVEKCQQHVHVEERTHSLVPHDAGILGISSVEQTFD